MEDGEAMSARLILGFFLALTLAAQSPVVLVVTADASDYLLSAGGTIAEMIDKGATAYLIRVTNDEKDSWDLSPEETALRTRAESEQAARILGVKEVVSLGYRAGEMAGVSFTEIRDRLIFYIRLYKPRVLFIPNPYNEYDRVLDRYYAGWAAEDAWRSAGFGNYAPPLGEAGLASHQTAELYYYGQPFDPRRREAESTATFVPEQKTIDISAYLARKVKAIQALRTINYSMAQRLNGRLTETGRRLRLLDTIDDDSVNRLAQKNVEGLAAIAAEGTGYHAAEEFHYAGLRFRIPSKYLQ
jgi:LmbE family N-acetylglucosaminyl deacetylase